LIDLAFMFKLRSDNLSISESDDDVDDVDDDDVCYDFPSGPRVLCISSSLSSFTLNTRLLWFVCSSACAYCELWCYLFRWVRWVVS